MRKLMIVTNNPSVKLKAEDIRVLSFGILDVLIKVRDLTHIGHHILTHPFAGSVKPNENPYRSVIVTAKPINIDYQSVIIAEGCLRQAIEMLKDKPYGEYSERVLKDWQLMDKLLLESGLESLKGRL